MIEIIGTALSQWDVGRSVQITGAEAEYAHFANKGDSKAVIMGIVDKNAKIPDYLLQTGKQLCVYAVKDGITIESKTFYVQKRERPEDYVYEDDQRNYIYELIASAEAAVEAANQAAEAAIPAADSANTAAENANSAAAGASEAAKNATDAAAKAAHTAKSLMVVGQANGALMRLDDAIDQYLVGLRIFGKTTQDGTPTPDAPVNMVSAGESGKINLAVSGKNLLPYPFYQTTLALNGLVFTDNKDGTVSISGTTNNPSSFWFTGYTFKLKKGVTYTLSIGDEITATGGPYVWVNSSSKGIISGINITSQKSVSFTPTEDISDAGIYVSASKEGMTFTGRIKPQIEVGPEATPFEKYKAQKLVLTTTNGLHGIDVLANGIYSDGDGQHWVCDEIDLDRGVRVDRCRDIVLDGTAYFTVGKHANGQCFCAYAAPGIANTDINNSKIVLSDRYEGTAWSNENNHVYAIGGTMVITDSRFTDNDAAAAILKAECPKFRYVLASPVETKLTDETIAAYKGLRTYIKDTTISNDAGADMELEYVMDAKKYIDSLIPQASAERVTNVSLPAAAWKGSGTLYSQVVSIAGITENSQVNLTPSVEQLAIFYEKDITFVTENDGGVVTIYVIGQKPQNDYTIQANIVEVIV